MELIKILMRCAEAFEKEKGYFDEKEFEQMIHEAFRKSDAPPVD